MSLLYTQEELDQAIKEHVMATGSQTLEDMETGSQGAFGGSSSQNREVSTIGQPQGSAVDMYASARKAKGGKGYEKKEKNVTFIQDSRDRMRKFKERGNVIINIAKELVIQTAAKISISMEYKGRLSSKIFKFPVDGSEATGASTEDEAGGRPSTPGDVAPFREAVKEGVKDAFSEIYKDRGTTGMFAGSSASGDDGSDSDASMPSQDSEESLTTRLRRRSGDLKSCFVCKSSEPMVNAKFEAVESEFVSCAAKPCVGQAHYDCLGLPELGPTDELDGKWYCRLHIKTGRSRVVSLHASSRAMASSNVTGTSSASRTSALFVAPGTQRETTTRKRGRPPLTRPVEDSTSRGAQGRPHASTSSRSRGTRR